MSNQLTHTKQILLVEDRSEFSTTISRWLAEEGYVVTLATCYAEAVDKLRTQHYHLAILDIRLDEQDALNEDGMKLLQEIERLGLKELMPCIVLTAYPNLENALAALNWEVARYIPKKPRYREELLAAVHSLFAEKVLINFDLVYDVHTPERIRDIAADVNFAAAVKPAADVLVSHVQDLFGKLFLKAQRLFVTKLRPGLTGAAVVRVHATWAHGMGPSYVAKIGRKDKVKTEQINYENHVAPFLPPNMTTQVDIAYTKDLGALLYRFADGDFRPLSEFDEYYRRHSHQEIAITLRNLFHNTGRYWYNNKSQRAADLSQLYYEAFELTEAMLIQRIQMVLPAFDPTAPQLTVADPALVVGNPIAWLAAYREECEMPVYQCITHGDLTGRNIMVNEDGHCWLIDFYRTYPSHILRDFVIFESDIKYRLLPDTISTEQFLALEQALLSTSAQESALAELPVAVIKVYHVINALHKIASDLLHNGGGQRSETRKEYLISLLMATLNVVRLRHITETRKVQALLSAALICTELDRLAGREAQESEKVALVDGQI